MVNAPPNITNMNSPPMGTAFSISRSLFTDINRTASCGWLRQPMPTPMMTPVTTVNQIGVPEAGILVHPANPPLMIAAACSCTSGRSISWLSSWLPAVMPPSRTYSQTIIRSIPANISVPWKASEYITAFMPPNSTYTATMAENTISDSSYPTPNELCRNLAAPIITAAAYTGMNTMMTMPMNRRRKGELNRLPISSANVWVFNSTLMRRVFLPKPRNAMAMPTKMHKNVSHITLMPYVPASPPNPMIADVEMNVAP